MKGCGMPHVSCNVHSWDPSPSSSSKSSSTRKGHPVTQQTAAASTPTNAPRRTRSQPDGHTHAPWKEPCPPATRNRHTPSSHHAGGTTPTPTHARRQEPPQATSRTAPQQWSWAELPAKEGMVRPIHVHTPHNFLKSTGKSHGANRQLRHLGKHLSPWVSGNGLRQWLVTNSLLPWRTPKNCS